MRTLLAAIKVATKYLWPVLKRRFWLFFALQLTSYIADQYFRVVEEQMNNSMSDNLAAMAANAGISIAFDLIWHAVFFLVVIITALEVFGERPLGLKNIKHDFNQLIIENMRVAARAIFWLPFFILPAIYKYIRLSMVSFIVVTDPEYRAGGTDALVRSERVTRGHFWLCALALLIVSLLDPLISGLINGGEISIVHNPVGSLLSFPASLVTELWAMIFLFAIYTRIAKIAPAP